MTKELLIGCHCSAAGGVFNALYEGQELGATTIQLFTSNQKQWKGATITPEIVAQWEEALKETGMEKVMSHAGYLINLGSPKADGLAKSRKAFSEEVERCLKLGIPYLNFHPGAALDGGEEACIERIIESLLGVAPLLKGEELTLLLETTAGQGSTVGHKFEHLAEIIAGVEKKAPIGVCIDTCHIFAAGYDIRTPKAWEAMLKEFDKVVGLKNLHAFHVNDSKGGLGSRKDRHANLGEGEIGLAAFKAMMQHPKSRLLPKYLETPPEPNRWPDEIKLLRKFGKG
ncbi:MAG: deoxyribonuclease IV [Parachlamydiales bacterium]